MLNFGIWPLLAPYSTKTCSHFLKKVLKLDEISEN